MRGFQLLLMAHCIGDYYLQTGRMSASKAMSYRHTLIHSIVYATPFLLLMLYSRTYYLLGLMAILAHCIIDLGKCAYLKLLKHKKNVAKISYVIDQFLHVTSLVLIAVILMPMDKTTWYESMLCYFVCVGQPTYVTLKIWWKEPIFDVMDLRGCTDRIHIFILAFGLWRWETLPILVVYFIYQMIKRDSYKQMIIRLGQGTFMVMIIKLLLWLMSGKGL